MIQDSMMTYVIFMKAVLLLIVNRIFKCWDLHNISDLCTPSKECHNEHKSEWDDEYVSLIENPQFFNNIGTG